MPVEKVGQQIRIRVSSPKKFTKTYGTQSFKGGKIQRVAAKEKGTGAWKTQSWRFNTKDYRSRRELNRDITNLELKQRITHREAVKARRLSKVV